MPIIFGNSGKAGEREHYEDRVFTGPVQTRGGLNLALAVVADGVGGRDKGEVAAQSAIDAVVKSIETGTDKNIPQLLNRAVKAANAAVYAISKERNGAGTTLSIGVVDQSNNTLYVANVGDSRVYLVRNQKLTQLTLDHTFANMMPIQGEMSAEAARANRKADSLMRALGPHPDIPVDVGFYVGTGDPTVAHQRGLSGLPLQKGDSILVCSDGVVDIGPDGKPYAHEEEIVRELSKGDGDDAANKIVSFAIGRETPDNASVAILQMPDNSRKIRAMMPLVYSGVAIAALLVVMVFLGRRLAASRGEVNEAAAALTQEADRLLGLTQTVAAYTPTPTATARPALIPGELGALIEQNGSRYAFIKGETLRAGGNAVINVNHTGEFEDGQIYMRPGSSILFPSDISDIIQFVVFPSSAIFIETGRYTGGAEITLSQAEKLTQFTVTGSCMSLDYTSDGQSLIAACYEGNCGYKIEYGQAGTGSIPVGSSISFNTVNLEPGLPQDISPEDAALWMQQVNIGQHSYGCIAPFNPTPTPTPSLTPTPGGTSEGFKDSDGDGFLDQDDTCPEEGNEGFGLNPNGCPAGDSDGDGMGDLQDGCPNAGDGGFGIDANGCPIGDADGDGVGDEEDACVNRGDEGFGLKPDGCPIEDGDGDGVGDNVDACPNDADEFGFGIYPGGCPIEDGDGDGVGDNVDACPEDGDEGFGLKTNGCPVEDGDGDGVGDNVDACPNRGDEGYGIYPGGCPVEDSDGDGVGDNVDACPDDGDEGFGVDGTGCPLPDPDPDGDGYIGNNDKCPNEGDEGFGVYNSPQSRKGCPIKDGDGDGVSDPNDACENDPGLPQFDGCPDTDGDGVPDPDDNCPDEGLPGEVDEVGCPQGGGFIIFQPFQIAGIGILGGVVAGELVRNKVKRLGPKKSRMEH